MMVRTVYIEMVILMSLIGVIWMDIDLKFIDFKLSEEKR